MEEKMDKYRPLSYCLGMMLQQKIKLAKEDNPIGTVEASTVATFFSVNRMLTHGQIESYLTFKGKLEGDYISLYGILCNAVAEREYPQVSMVARDLNRIFEWLQRNKFMTREDLKKLDLLIDKNVNANWPEEWLK